MRKKAMKLLSVMLAIFMAFAAVPLSGLAGIDLPIFRASAVEETETEISGKLGTKLTWSIDKASKTLTINNKGQMISFSQRKRRGRITNHILTRSLLMMAARM